jgi:uncharacterized protein (DUF1800 family)
LLSACGGGSGKSSINDNSNNTPQPQTSILTLTTVEALAIEKSNQLAKVTITRTEASQALIINYTVTGNSDTSKGSVSSNDYTLVYSDNNIVVGSNIELAENQNTRVIEVRPVQDDIHEVPETLTFTLNASSDASYELSNGSTAIIGIVDAANTNENAKVFTGAFTAQGSAVTTASGQLSLILQGDNESATITYSFYGLSSAQIDQHIHVSPSGNPVRDIEHFGSLTDYQWDLSPGDIFTNEQQMLDALFNGQFYINIHTATFQHGEISAPLNYQVDQTPADVKPLTEEEVDHDIVRFLNQATYGATPEDYQALRASIAQDGSNRIQAYEAWIDSQISQTPSDLLELTDVSRARFKNDCGDDGACLKDDRSRSRRDAFWTTSVFAKDQLRQRVAFALSEIVVIGDDNNRLIRADRGSAHYWNQLANNAFGTYRKIIEDVSLSPIMGHWLSHLKNQKANAELGAFPDENYAREVMQLFSFGLVHRNSDGTLTLDQNNLPMETYDNVVIKSLARVFTGLSYSYYTRSNNGSHVNNDYGNIMASNTSFSRADTVTADQYRYRNPMKYFPEYHDYGEKTLWTDNGRTVVVPASTAETEQAANSELGFVLDELVKHSSTGPAISEKLIQRFVTSNPSPEYLERVVTAFGETGDMTAIMKAILLDREARNPRNNQSITFGKFKEPLLHMTAIMRLFGVYSNIALDNTEGGLNLSTANLYDDNASILRMGDLNLGQQALASPSVFNFFLPSYTPAGELASQAVKSPELQLMTETQVYSTFNVYDDLLSGKIYRTVVRNFSDATTEDLLIRLPDSVFNQWWNQASSTNEDKSNAVVEKLDFYLNGGYISRNSSDQTLSILSTTLANADEDERFDLAIYGVAVAPSFNIQK